MAYITAFMEAFTLENFPYYQHTDKWLMYKYGSAFYALYFIVSFPMFAR
jgi:cycloeucalenol cycloisomerase